MDLPLLPTPASPAPPWEESHSIWSNSRKSHVTLPQTKRERQWANDHGWYCHTPFLEADGLTEGWNGP